MGWFVSSVGIQAQGRLPEPVLGEVRTRPGGDDVCVGECRRHVDLRDARVGIRATDHREIDHVGGAHVVDPLGLAQEELAVFLPLDPGADCTSDLDLDGRGHCATSAIALTMFW